MPVAEAALAYVAMKVLEQLEGELGGAASRQVRAWFKRDPQRLACELALADTERTLRRSPSGLARIAVRRALSFRLGAAAAGAVADARR